MKKKTQITLGILQLLIFSSISIAEFLDPQEFGFTLGKVVEVKDNGIACLGKENQLDAIVVLDFYSELHIPITTRYLSNHLTKGKRAPFIYWGRKSEIESPLQSLEDPSMYYSDVQIGLFSIESWVTWYYLLFQIIKWGSLITGVLLLLPVKLGKLKKTT